jgi:predicted alpha/beta superfamily hydrolase
MKKLFGLLILQVSFFNYGIGQANNLSIGKEVSIKSEVLKEDRSMLIYTPDGYQKSEDKYPILYILDAEWNFHYVSGLVEQLSNTGNIPKMIVIGIVNTNRSRDLTPSGINDNPNVYGGARNFLDFLVMEVQPLIEKKFRVYPYRVLAGHSFGGLFAIYCMMEQSNFFQSYIALSPSLGRNNEQQVRMAQTFFNSDEQLPKSLFLAVGNEGGATYLSTIKLASIIEDSDINEHKFRWKLKHFEKEDHASITIHGFLEGLEFIFEGINPEKHPELDDIFLIEEHYKELASRFGYEFQVPEYYYQKFVKEQISELELDYAFFILGKYKERYPESHDMISLYADAFLLKGDFKNAKKYYVKLKELGINDERLNEMLNNLDK